MNQPLTTEVPDSEKILAKAFLRASKYLGLNGVQMANISGLSESHVSRMKQGNALSAGAKQRECIIYFLRLYRSLLPLVGDHENARIWLNSSNKALGGKPIELIGSIGGLVNAVRYCDAMRGKV